MNHHFSDDTRASLKAPTRKIVSAEWLMAGLALITGAAAFLVHFLYFRHSFPPSNLDEASFFSPAYSMATKGQLSSDIHTTFLPGASSHTYWMPPLYMFLLSGVLKVFGTTVLNAKLFSFLLMLTAATLLTFLTRDRFIKGLLAGLFLLCPFIIISSAYIRMESLGVLLIVAAILAVKNRISPVWMGILAGLGAMTHPLVLSCAAALALYNLRKGLKPLLVFGIAALITVSPYIYYILQDLSSFQDQMAAQMARKIGRDLGSIKAEYLLQTIPSAVLALLLLFRSRMEKELRIFLATGLVLAVLIIIKSMEFNYHVYAIPYVLAALGLSMEEYRTKNLYRYYLPVFFMGLFTVFLFSKASKYEYRDDSTYNQLITYLAQQRGWEGKSIYVTGDPDVSIFFLMHGQQVERQNAVAAGEKGDWFRKFNVVVSVVENDRETYRQADYAWAQWKPTGRFTTSDGVYTLLLFTPNP